MAAYAAALPYEKQVRCYSKLLENVTIISERQRYLMLADEAGTCIYTVIFKGLVFCERQSERIFIVCFH